LAHFISVEVISQHCILIKKLTQLGLLYTFDDGPIQKFYLPKVLKTTGNSIMQASLFCVGQNIQFGAIPKDIVEGADTIWESQTYKPFNAL